MERRVFQKLDFRVLSELSGSKKVEMTRLMNRFNTQQIQMPEFLRASSVILGSQLYSRMVASNASDKLASRDTVQGGLEDEQSRVGESRMSDFRTKPEGADAIQDIIQCSGINLKEEAENIMRERDKLLCQIVVSPECDEKTVPRLLFDANVLYAIVSIVSKGYNISNASNPSPKIFEKLLCGLQIRYANILDELIMISRNRTNTLRQRYTMRIDNDPKKQIQILDKLFMEKVKTYIKPEGDGGGKRHKMDAGQSPADKAQSEMEESYIKTKITNAMVMNQLGMPMKRWMVDATIPTDGHATGLGTQRSPDDIFGKPEQDKTLALSQKSIKIQDLMFFMSYDKRLSNSILLMEAQSLFN